jgi:hypothetical protein
MNAPDHIFMRLIKFYQGQQVEEDEKGRACTTYRGDNKCLKHFNNNI